jgi:hypothetical protein
MLTQFGVLVWVVALLIVVLSETLLKVKSANTGEVAIASTEPMIVGAGEAGNAGVVEQP